MLKDGSNLVPEVLMFYVKLIIGIFTFYIVLNLFLFVSFYFKISSYSKLVQDSVEMHGYLPAHDYKAIKGLVDDMMKQSEKEDTEFGITLPGINKVITNLQIAVWDDEGKGFRNAADDSSYVKVGNYDDLEDESGPGYYIGISGVKHKRQQGDILYAGLVFEYHILVPVPYWDYSMPSYVGSDATFSTNGKPFYGTVTAEASRKKINDDITNDTYSMNTEKSNNGYVNDFKLFGMSPVICREWYADLDQEKTYNSKTGE